MPCRLLGQILLIPEMKKKNPPEYLRSSVLAMLRPKQMVAKQYSLKNNPIKTLFFIVKIVL